MPTFHELSFVLGLWGLSSWLLPQNLKITLAVLLLADVLFHGIVARFVTTHDTNLEIPENPKLNDLPNISIVNDVPVHTVQEAGPFGPTGNHVLRNFRQFAMNFDWRLPQWMDKLLILIFFALAFWKSDLWALTCAVVLAISVYWSSVVTWDFAGLVSSILIVLEIVFAAIKEFINTIWSRTSAIFWRWVEKLFSWFAFIPYRSRTTDSGDASSSTKGSESVTEATTSTSTYEGLKQSNPFGGFGWVPHPFWPSSSSQCSIEEPSKSPSPASSQSVTKDKDKSNSKNPLSTLESNLEIAKSRTGKSKIEASKSFQSLLDAALEAAGIPQVTKHLLPSGSTSKHEKDKVSETGQKGEEKPSETTSSAQPTGKDTGDIRWTFNFGGLLPTGAPFSFGNPTGLGEAAASVFLVKTGIANILPAAVLPWIPYLSQLLIPSGSGSSSSISPGQSHDEYTTLSYTPKIQPISSKTKEDTKSTTSTTTKTQDNMTESSTKDSTAVQDIPSTTKMPQADDGVISGCSVDGVEGEIVFIDGKPTASSIKVRGKNYNEGCFQTTTTPYQSASTLDPWWWEWIRNVQTTKIAHSSKPTTTTKAQAHGVTKTHITYADDALDITGNQDLTSESLLASTTSKGPWAILTNAVTKVFGETPVNSEQSTSIEVSQHTSTRSTHVPSITKSNVPTEWPTSPISQSPTPVLDKVTSMIAEVKDEWLQWSSALSLADASSTSSMLQSAASEKNQEFPIATSPKVTGTSDSEGAFVGNSSTFEHSYFQSFLAAVFTFLSHLIPDVMRTGTVLIARGYQASFGRFWRFVMEKTLGGTATGSDLQYCSLCWIPLLIQTCIFITFFWAFAPTINFFIENCRREKTGLIGHGIASSFKFWTWIPSLLAISASFAAYIVLERGHLIEVFRNNKPLLAFTILALFKGVKVVVHAFSYYFLSYPAELPVLRYCLPRDVTFIVPNTGPFDNDLQQRLASIMSNNPGSLMIVTCDIPNNVKALTLAQSYGENVQVLMVHNQDPREIFLKAITRVQTPITVFATEHSEVSHRFLKSTLAEFEDPRVGTVVTPKQIHLDSSFLNSLWSMIGEREIYESTASYNIDGGVGGYQSDAILVRTEILHSLDFRSRFTHEAWAGTGNLEGDCSQYITRYAMNAGWRTAFRNDPDATVHVDYPPGLTAYTMFVVLDRVNRARATYRHNLIVLLGERSCWWNCPWSTYALFMSFFAELSLFYDAALISTLHSATGTEHLCNLIFLILVSKIIPSAKYLEKDLGHTLYLPLYLIAGYLDTFIKIYAFCTMWILDDSWKDD